MHSPLIGNIRTALFLGAHCDDIEIGCGGTILRLLYLYPDLEIWWIVFSGDARRKEEAERAAMDFTRGCPRLRLAAHGFRDGYFPYEGSRIKDTFEELKNECNPDIVFTHHGQDRHQDHRLLCELTWNSFRDHLILEYEIPKYDGDLGNPNVFFQIPDGDCEEKIRLLKLHYGSQQQKTWFKADTFRSLMRLRGIECRSSSGYAEAFYSRKVLLSA